MKNLCKIRRDRNNPTLHVQYLILIILHTKSNHSIQLHFGFIFLSSLTFLKPLLLALYQLFSDTTKAVLFSTGNYWKRQLAGYS